MIPSHLLEIESKLLDTYLQTPDLFEKCHHLVSTNIFLRSVTKAGYDIIKNLHSQNVSPDASLIFAQLKKLGFSQADCAVITGGNFDYSYVNQTEKYVDILFKHSVANYLMPILADTHQKLLSETGDSIELMDNVSEAINRVSLVVNNVSKSKSVHEVFDLTLQRIINAKNNEGGQLGFSFGLKELDKKTGGIIQGTNIIAALPGGGKSTLVINIIRANAIDNNNPMLFFSVEMPSIEVMTNLIANITDINSRALRQGDIDAGELLSIQSAKERLRDNFEIDDTGGVTWQYAEAKIKAFRKKHKIPPDQMILVAADYLQIMGNSEHEKRLSKEERLEIICNEFTRICKNDNVALVLLSQFGKEAAKRDVPRPKMHDLKGTAAIEANAVLILLMFRPEYHGMFTGDKGEDLRGLVEINIAKGRYTKPEPVYARFIGKYSKFLDYEPESTIQTTADPSF